MRKVKRWRYYCDFCKKSGGSGGHMKKHEAGCTMNPNRVCGMCEINEEGSEQRPMAELLAIIEADGQPSGPTDEFGCYSMEYYKKISGPVPDALREATNGCPACILAALRQSGAYYEFDYQKEREELWAQIHDDERERIGSESLFESSYYG